MLLQYLHQRGLHKGVIVGDVEAVNALVAQQTAKFFGQFASMAAFHHQDQFGPLQQLRADRIVGIAVDPG